MLPRSAVSVPPPGETCRHPSASRRTSHPPGVSVAAGQRRLACPGAGEDGRIRHPHGAGAARILGAPARRWRRGRGSRGRAAALRPGPHPTPAGSHLPTRASSPPLPGRKLHSHKRERAPAPAQRLSHGPVFLGPSGAAAVPRAELRTFLPAVFQQLQQGCLLHVEQGSWGSLPPPQNPFNENPFKGLCCPREEGSGQGRERAKLCKVVGRAEARQHWQGSPGKAGLQGLPPPAPSLPPAVAIVRFSHW